ncbi:MAG: nucleotidyltransferase domain-containing protein [Bacteroidetes bacterium]|jgi:predicted nucleotidyltransferase|nr:nucleotidyltransferase domain-containing protein [Bacteroidota bacterium]
MNDREKILSMIKKLVDKHAPNSDVYLFGSQARGDAKALSDWDLLILLQIPKVSFDVETKFMDKFYELELKTGEIFSPLIYSKHNWNSNYLKTPFYQNIKKESIKIK